MQYSKILEQLVPCRRCGRKDKLGLVHPGPMVKIAIRCERCDFGMSGDSWEDVTHRWNMHNFDAADFYIQDEE